MDWFHLESGDYRRVAAGDDEIIRGVVFPGLWLDPAALTRFNSTRVLGA